MAFLGRLFECGLLFLVELGFFAVGLDCAECFLEVGGGLLAAFAFESDGFDLDRAIGFAGYFDGFHKS